MMAEDVLAFYLYDKEREGVGVPEPTKLNMVKADTNEFVNYHSLRHQRICQNYTTPEP